MTFAETTRAWGKQGNHSTIITQPQLSFQSLITREESLKINICVAHAHYKTLNNPGTYAEELNKTLTLNGLPNIKIPGDDDPGNTNTNNIQIPSTNPINTSQNVQESNKEEAAPNNKQLGNMEEQLQPNMEEQIQPKEAKDIGLKLFTTNDRGWPRTNFTRVDLINGIYKKIYKWTFEDANYTDNHILKLITEGSIKLNDCWYVVEDDIFRKIRPGITEERTPPKERDPRLRKITQ